MTQTLKFESEARPGEYLGFVRKAASGSNLPLVIHIHGAGGRGNDISEMLTGGPIGANVELDAVIVQPQCHTDTWFELFDVLLEFIKSEIDRPEIDKNRVYLMGGSMGGYTSWQVAMSRPDWFAALVPICGGGMYWNAAKLKNIPIWAFHGALDNVVLPEESLHMVKAVNEAGGNAKLTIYPKNAHNAWDDTINSKEMWDWMFSQKRG